MKKQILIIGGGAAALILACELDPDKFEISIYEKNAALGRKFLVAGEGGLNFTHSEPPENFIKRYTPPAFLQRSFFQFSNAVFIQWMNALGIETFVGSSGRLFPKKGIKPIQVLEQILKRIKQNKVKIYHKHIWEGFVDNGSLIFSNANERLEVKSDLTVFSLGGASWSVTGSDGAWAGFFKDSHIQINKFQSSNCAFKVEWDEALIPKIEGKSLKNCSFSCGNKKHLGEVVLTKFGMEGSGIYPLSPEIRAELAKSGEAHISIDLKPSFSLEKIREKLNDNSSKKNLTARLKEDLNLNEIQVLLLKKFLSKEQFLDSTFLSLRIKNFECLISGLAPIDESISSTGGLSLEEIDEKFELKKMKHHFVIGEMLDYDAPTGGYLLQSCFSMSKYLADYLNSAYS